MPCKRACLSIGVLLGKLEGVHFPGLLGVIKSISGSLSWTRRSFKILSLSETLASLRHTYLGSFFLDPEDISKLSIGAI